MYPIKPPKGGARPRITTAYRVAGDWIAGFHTGTDFGWTRKSERVRATFKGIVVHVGRGDRHYGNYVVIWHPEVGRYSWYCHLASIRPSIRAGVRVGTGRWLGYMGSTGNATGRHLHYEERNTSNAYGGHLRPVLFTHRRPPYALRKAGWR